MIKCICLAAGLVHAYAIALVFVGQPVREVRAQWITG